ncbi:unnamed protein product [Discosporangium mesarthrocarpum]
MSSMRLLLSLAAEYNWDLVHLNVKTAFLQSEMKEEIYVRQPRGFEKHSPPGAPYACRLRRSLYGLCQSPASWFSTIHQFLLDIELKSCLADPCVYVKGSGTVILMLYVNDIIISGASSDAINKVEEKLMTKFDMSYLGDVTTFLGMDIVRDCSTGVLLIRQCRYIHPCHPGALQHGPLQSFRRSWRRSIPTSRSPPGHQDHHILPGTCGESHLPGLLHKTG